MTLNRNPENFFAQIEQTAFPPGNTVPGIHVRSILTGEVYQLCVFCLEIAKRAMRGVSGPDAQESAR
jgi:catalase